MQVFLSLSLFIGGLWLIIKGGDYLVNAALKLNKITGINQVIIGATFVSVATTLPEVFVSMFAVMANNHGIAVGNAIGSMIANIALVLALYITFRPGTVKRSEILNKSIFLIIITVLVILFAANLWLSWYEGTFLLCAFVLFIYLNIRESKRREPHLPVCAPPQVSKPCITKEERRKSIQDIIYGFSFGQIMLIIGAFCIVEHGEKLAHLFNISETVVGFTVIAVGTSLPELITVITSIRKKSGGLALGNVVGANIINCTLLLGTCGIIGDIKGNSLPISRATLLISLPFLLLLSLIAIAPMLIRGKAYRWQGILLMILYVCYVCYLAVVQPI